MLLSISKRENKKYKKYLYNILEIKLFKKLKYMFRIYTCIHKINSSSNSNSDHEHIQENWEKSWELIF